MPAEIPTNPNPIALPQGDREEFLAAAHQNMERYGEAPYEIGSLVVDHVVDEETRLMAYEVREDHLARGSSAAAFLVQEQGAAEPDVLTVSYTPAVKADHPLARASRLQETDDRIEALRRAQGLPGHAQLKAADREHGLVIATKAPGEDIFDHKSSVQPTAEHWNQLHRTAKGMRRRRIGFDAKGGNIHWDPQAGFTVYDTHPVGFNPKKWVRPGKLVKGAKARVAIQNSSRSSEPVTML